MTNLTNHTFRKREYWRRNAALWFLAIFLCATSVTALYQIGVSIAYERLRDTTQQQLQAELELQVQVLQSLLEKYRLLPSILSQHSVLTETLNNQLPVDEAWLQQVRYLTGAYNVLIVNQQGELVSAADDIELTPLNIEPILQATREGRLGRGYRFINDYTLLYGFATSVSIELQDLVLIVWVDLSEVFRSWALANATIVAYDENDVVTLASEIEWINRYRGELTEFTASQNKVLSITQEHTLDWYIEAELPVDDSNLQRQAILISVIICIGILLLFALLIWRREQQHRTVVRDKIYALELERQVEASTKELTDANQHLTEEIEERKRTEQRLQTTQKELVHSAKLAAIGQMSTTLSHEYNQPLTAMRTYAENAQVFLSREDDEMVAENLQHIIKQTDRLGHLSRVLMSFARKPSDGKSSISVQACVDEAIMLVRPRIKSNQVSIETDIESSAMLHVNALQISQVLLNLLTNAIDAVQEQSTSYSSRIFIRARKIDDQIKLTVEDSGPGIPIEKQEQVFEPFFTTKAQKKGLGLGLCVVKNIVGEQNGELSLQTSELGGACFTLRLPAVLLSQTNV